MIAWTLHRAAVLTLGVSLGCGFQAPTVPEPDETPDASFEVTSDAAAVPLPADAATGSWQEVDRFSVWATGEVRTSGITLQTGVQYRLRASGTYFARVRTSRESEIIADAEYANFNAPIDVFYSGGTSPTVDVGLAIDDDQVGGLAEPAWGAYRPLHVYEVMWIGAGAPITARVHDADYSNNAGALILTIFEWK
jgi:hypothetical protein